MKFNKENILLIIKKPLVILAAILIFAAGVLFGVRWHRNAVIVPSSSISRIGLQNSNFKFVAPLLAIDIGEQKDFKEFGPFQDDLNSVISQLKGQGKVSDVGLYFRDFKNGHWVGINENEKFFPASLLKVPLMIAYFKESESDSSLLSKKLFYDGKLDANQFEYVKPSHAIVAGQYYTVEQLIEYMIKYSDNNAANVLVANIDQNSFSEIYSDLNIDLPTAASQLQDFLTPKQYSLFFRILRNGTYLTDELSEKALDLLSQADFNGGLADGNLPSGAVVAHKFGEALVESNPPQQQHEFHDCGIIYSPDNLYLLCVMTKGQNYEDLKGAIKAISNVTYKAVVNNFK